ncbi:IclR family transcriptional regulator [Thalassovita taeanensis]|uniref:Transcriptional regulator, IclR family n=1 Tax=Thalassovita taeanensis TaxID=657014 RepID=A0A1H9IYI9_9RHOB|nr:IclR family transcriptional regulator [Thalassovita taeanensis]SEQ79592.1 transcriptional regulator, IclR family [Thalassovita taeanensis]
MTDDGGTSSGLTSLDTALRVLAYMARQGGAQPLSEIAGACEMSASKAHRYLASFVAAGMVQQRGSSRKYNLGPAALELGLAALAQHDFVNNAARGLADLSAETEMTVLLSVWANQGATVVRWERGSSPTDTSMGLGTTLPLLTSATGRVFLVWGPQRAISPVRDAQLKRLARQPRPVLDFEPSQSGVSELISLTRQRQFASVEGRFIPGLVAAAAPVLDWQGEVQAAITLVGTDPDTIGPTTSQVQKLLDYCSKRSVGGVST